MSEDKYILIVDDEEEIIELIIRRMCSKWTDSIRPLVALDGFEALDFMRTKNIAAMVLDIRMKNLNGIQVCREAMNDQKMKSIPIIVSSGFLECQDRDELRALGVKHFLDKPYQIEQLMTKIEEIINTNGRS